MNFLQKLESHTGGLLRIKSELYWYDGRGPDGIPGRVCLLLDAAAGDGTLVAARTANAATRANTAAVLLLIDGAPHWVWVAQQDVELIA